MNEYIGVVKCRGCARKQNFDDGLCESCTKEFMWYCHNRNIVVRDMWGNLHNPKRFVWGVSPRLDLTHGQTAVALDMFLEQRKSQPDL